MMALDGDLLDGCDSGWRGATADGDLRWVWHLIENLWMGATSFWKTFG